MRVLTIHRPWDWAIMIGGKDVENRSWYTSYRGPLAIHAGLKYDTLAAIQCPELVLTAFQIKHTRPESDWLTKSPAGRVLGIVNLDDCVRDSTSRWAEPGAWHWVLSNPRRLPKPLAATGRQKLWHPDPDLARALADLEATP